MAPLRPLRKHEKQKMENNARRSFLKKATLAGGAALLGSATSWASTSADAAEETTGPTGMPVKTSDGHTVLQVLQTTDVHCQIHPHDELFWENDRAVFRKTGGYAQLATYLRKTRKKGASYLIDTGDMFQGSELSVQTSGAALVPILNALDYDLYLPGNWEVIYYKQAMQRLLGSLHAPKVCANMYHAKPDGSKGELIFPAYSIWEVDGIKVGFLGYTDPLVPLRQSPNYSKGIVYTAPEENLAHYVDVLRNQEQCAAVLVVAHLGLSQQIHLANLPECSGVDYILGGDTHERVREPIPCTYAKVVEPGAFGSFVGRLELHFKDGKLVDSTYALDEITASKYSADPAVAALLAAQEIPFKNSIERVLGTSKVPLYRYFVVENPIDQMVLDALKWRLPEVDVVLSNGFRFCPPRTTPDANGLIPITHGYLFDMLPVDSTVRIAEASGQQIMDWLEKELNNVFAAKANERFGGWVIKFKGMQVEFYAYKPKGQRVASVRIQGVPLDPQRMYVLSACERDGDPQDMLCRIKGVKNARNTPHTLHSTMEAYLAANSPVSPTPEGNARVLDAPQNLLTQVTGVPYSFR